MGAVHAEDKGQACQEGWNFYGIWQTNQSEGSSRHQDRQGLLCQGSQRQHLKSSGTSDQFGHSSLRECQGAPQLNVLAWLQLRTWGYLRPLSAVASHCISSVEHQR